MHNTTKTIILNLLFCSILVGFSFCNSAHKYKKVESLTKNIGDTFNIRDFLDTSGAPVNLDLTRSPITIIDFWINECPPCNAEMSQFEDILKGKEKKVTVVSISVSYFSFWKKLFIEKSKKYEFLTTSVSNWQHLNLKSNDDPKLGNEISLDRFEEIQAKLDVTYFPSYFVLDKNGIIILRPVSAVDYIKTL